MNMVYKYLRKTMTTDDYLDILVHRYEKVIKKHTNKEFLVGNIAAYMCVNRLPLKKPVDCRVTHAMEPYGGKYGRNKAWNQCQICWITTLEDYDTKKDVLKTAPDFLKKKKPKEPGFLKPTRGEKCPK